LYGFAAVAVDWENPEIAKQEYAIKRRDIFFMAGRCLVINES
jgi:hypothetical protein